MPEPAAYALHLVARAIEDVANGLQDAVMVIVGADAKALLDGKQKRRVA